MVEKEDLEDQYIWPLRCMVASIMDMVKQFYCAEIKGRGLEASYFGVKAAVHNNIEPGAEIARYRATKSSFIGHEGIPKSARY